MEGEFCRRDPWHLILLAAVVGTAVGFLCRNAAFARKEKEQEDQFWLSLSSG